jgi:predicted nucleotidyltransferase
MTDEQQALFEALTAHLEREPAVEALWLAGSLGAGEGDAFSDVDLLVLAREGGWEGLSATLARELAGAFDAVLVESLFGGRVVNFVTADWARFDLSIVERDGLARYDANRLRLVFNRSDAAPPARPETPYRTPPATAVRLAREFLRVLGLLPNALGRGELLNALSGVDILRRLTVELMHEENGVAPDRRGGALHPSRFLRPEQVAALTALPPVVAERESLIEGNRALARLFLARARALAGRIGAEWPQALEEACRRHLRTSIRLEI